MQSDFAQTVADAQPDTVQTGFSEQRAPEQDGVQNIPQQAEGVVAFLKSLN